jgi:hypothetical protein
MKFLHLFSVIACSLAVLSGPVLAREHETSGNKEKKEDK